MARTMQIHLTSECTVRCPYCYIHQCKDSALTFETFLQQYVNREKVYSGLPMDNGVDKYQVCFFGGEPTLHTDVMYRIADYMWNEGTVEQMLVITNGTLLTKEMVAEFEKHHMAYNVSFDGLWQKRIPYNKEFQPKSETYFQTLENLFKSGIIHNQSKVMVSPDCIDTLIENYEYLTGLYNTKSPDFSFVKDDIWTEADLNRLDVKLSEFVHHLVNKSKTSGDMWSVGFVNLFLADTFLSKKYHRNFQCYAGTSGCCFTPSGVVYPCSRWYTNKKMPLYDSNTDHVYQESYDFFTKNWNTDTWKECNTCILKDKCHFGCHYSEAERQDFQSIRPLPVVCKLTKILYKYSYLYYQELKDNFDIPAYVFKMFNIGG